LGPAELLLRYGDDEQKHHYLPRLARGDEIPCFALTNPYAGSDAASIPDNGIVCRGTYRGEDVLGIRVTWEKRYITLAPIATLLGLAFHLYDPDGLLGGQEDVGITLALLPTDHPGVQIGQRHYPAQQAFQNGPTTGEDVFIPLSWVIGGEARCGDGWRMLMNCLAAGRSISLPASSTAGLKVCDLLRLTVEHIQPAFFIEADARDPAKRGPALGLRAADFVDYFAPPCQRPVGSIQTRASSACAATFGESAEDRERQCASVPCW
jgi:alkylation response protein AidB-like acyl-CoA dehydrogenase